MAKKHKPILFIDDGTESNQATQLLVDEKIECTLYHIRKFEKVVVAKSQLPITTSIFAQDEVFKGFEGIEEYVSYRKSDGYDDKVPVYTGKNKKHAMAFQYHDSLQAKKQEDKDVKYGKNATLGTIPKN